MKMLGNERNERYEESHVLRRLHSSYSFLSYRTVPSGACSMGRIQKPRNPRAVLDVQCGRCGHINAVTSDEVLRGRWRDCPVCGASADAVKEGDGEDVEPTA